MHASIPIAMPAIPNSTQPYRNASILLLLVTVLAGCAVRRARNDDSVPTAPCISNYQEFEPPLPCCPTHWEAAVSSIAPRTVDELPTEFWDLTLNEAVEIAIQQSEVIRNAGGRVLDAPEASMTIYEPGIDYYDPNFGVQAALSAFDTNLSSQFSYAKNDRVFNNQTLAGGGARELQQDLVTHQNQLSRVGARGGQTSLRSLISHDRNNRDSNLFGSLWESQLEAEVRQPLLQGAGLDFNRVAGPNARPGLRFTNGLVIAQINNNMSKVDFEIAVRGLVEDVENTYWQLHQAYHDYSSKKKTRDLAEETLQSLQAKYEQGLAGGEADKEAQARAQFYYHEDLALEALVGSGSTPGVFESERQLRILLGMPANDGRMLRPSDSVSEARLVYDWDSLSQYALSHRAEIRRQLWKVRQEELRLAASKNFLMPRIDALAVYRLRGFGDDLAGNGPGRFNSAFEDIGSLDHQEWEFGLQLNVPLGQRQAAAGVRHAELKLSRERSILREQELQVSHALASAITRTSQTQASIQASHNRMVAAQQRVDATESAYNAGKVPVDLLLDAQERLGAAESRYFQAILAHSAAETGVRMNAGQLLASHGIVLHGNYDEPFVGRPQSYSHEVDYRMRETRVPLTAKRPDTPSFERPLAPGQLLQEQRH